MTFPIKQLLALGFCILLSFPAFAQIDGALLKADVIMKGCALDSIDLEYRIKLDLVEQPQVQYAVSWIGADETMRDCLTFGKIVMIVSHPKLGRGQIILDSKFKESEEGPQYGKGSKRWNTFVKRLDEGKAPTKIRYYTEREAKQFFKEGKIIDFKVQ
ncbi:hypothetical protein [Pontibacter sp. G13]|uniref:hypothetical protein n=1 Tax=Pontibacter sp. G13 TaxID=3074898 RepID=UPI00288B8534|nr:hypothetical protein [Pontibacter sp. G13]WNJ19930.1 hypothetical protein RJD25_05555 [Pontibacter sp. G13]